jgi:hypothetical protein
VCAPISLRRSADRLAGPSACPVQWVCRISLRRFSDRHACPSACPVRSVCRISLHCSADWRSRHLRFLAADLHLFSFSRDLYTAFAACSCSRHDTNPPWYKLKASCCREGMPKRFSNDDTMVWILIRCKTQTWKLMCGRLPGKRIVYSASKVTTCSSVYQTCQVVVNSMLHQQGDNMVIMYQSWHATATVKQDDNHFI